MKQFASPSRVDLLENYLYNINSFYRRINYNDEKREIY
jgi:hypothetical protein